MSENWQYGQPPGEDPYGGPGPYDPYEDPTSGYGNPGAGYGTADGGYGDPGFAASGGYGDPGFAASGGYPYPPYVAPPGQGSMIGALVMAIILMVTCCGAVSVVGVVFSALALGEKYDHERAAKYKRYAWISNWINLGIVLFVIVGYVSVIVWGITTQS